MENNFDINLYFILIEDFDSSLDESFQEKKVQIYCELS
jgi:hypothetical protein